MINKKNLIILATIVLGIILILWLTGLISLWTDGIAYIANNTKDFSDKKGHILDGEHSVIINLSDLESNIGKELYNDGTHKIYVNYIENSGSLFTGGYIIGFRSSGQYSLSHATLVSGIHHATVDNNSFTYSMSAKMTAEYNGKTYNSSVAGLSGLNYKDGDEFSFYIFPSEAYNEGISLKEEGKVYLNVKKLYKNIWRKK